MFKPKLFTTLKGYTAEDFTSDLIAGVVVGVVALPLAIAFGIASGVSPEKGLVTAIVAGFLISVLGGSRVQIGGPTGAFVVVVLGILHKYGPDGLVLATILAGFLLVAMGLFRLGDVIKFVPHPLVVGFTSGIAMLIFSSQIKDFFGLPGAESPESVLGKWQLLFSQASHVSFPSLFIALSTVLLIKWTPKISSRIPGSLVAILLCSAAAVFFGWPVETIGSRFGALPTTLPRPSLPAIDFETLRRLAEPAFTIAILGGIESLLSATVADGMIGSRHRSNTELIAQGIGNIGSGLFGGIPATGAIARTATNVKNGAKTPVAGIIHALTLLAILLFAGKWAVYIPMACLAGILAMVAYHMSEWRSGLALLRGPRADVLVFSITFLLTVLVDLTFAIEVGMVLSAFLFIHQMSAVTRVRMIESELEEEAIDLENLSQKTSLPKGVEVYEINGPLFFGVSREFEETMRVVSKKPRVRILRMERVPYVDASALHALKGLHKSSRKSKVRLILCGVQPEPLTVMKESGFCELLGEANFTTTLSEALKKAEEVVTF